jgi:hypothetical protein
MQSVHNSDQLRNAIDSGMTGDKVDASDPAAAPLGTDDEAAGVQPQTGSLRSLPTEPGRSTNRPDNAVAITYAMIIATIGLLLVVLVYAS